MIFYCVKSVSHFLISRLTVFVEDVNIIRKRGSIQTSRRYGVAANTKTTLGHPPLSDNFPRVRTRPPRNPGGCWSGAGWRGATMPRESPMAALGIGATSLLHVVRRCRITFLFRLLPPRYAVTISLDDFTKCECIWVALIWSRNSSI